MSIKNILLIFLVPFLFSCGNSNENLNNELEEYYSYDDGFESGDYCAEVDYYNPNTGTSSTYTLNVEVEDNVLVTVHWPNGGWLDETHYLPADLDEDGYCSFESDKGYEYEVRLNGSPCSYTDESSMYYDREKEMEEYTCSICGGEKDSYEDYCDDCLDEIEDAEDERNNTCSRCGYYAYGVYGGMCDDCIDEVENTCSQCGGYAYGVYGGICDDCEDDY